MRPEKLFPNGNTIDSDMEHSSIQQNEVWLPIPGCEATYEISSHGRVRSRERVVTGRWGGPITKTSKIRNHYLDKNGYPSISLWVDRKRITIRVHKLVAAAFLPPSEFTEVNHKDFDKQNNKVENLEFISRRENQIHAVKGGRYSLPSKPRGPKLNEEKVILLRKLRKEGDTLRSLSKMFGISEGTAGRIVKLDLWPHAGKDASPD